MSGFRMRQLSSGCLMIVFGITGFIADVFSILDHLPYAIPGIRSVQILSFYSGRDNPTFSLFLIFYGLIGTGVLFWAWLYPRASTPIEGIRLFMFAQLVLAGILLFLYFEASEGHVVAAQFTVYLFSFAVICGVISWNIYRFLTLPKYP